MLRLATRSSQLAIAQTETVRQLLAAAGFEATLTPLPASAEARAAQTTDKGRFVRGVEQALLDGEADIGVHSAKDLPSDLLPGLRLAATPLRADAADAFVGAATSLADLAVGARVGTASLRRRSQLLALRPDLQVEELRGNVDTRLTLVEERGLSGAILAAAGLARLGRESEIAFRFGVEELLPAAGQGVLALEIREGDEDAAAAAAAISHAETWRELVAERALVAGLEADCDTPVGARATLGEDGQLELIAYVGRADGSDWVRDRLLATTETDAAAADLGTQVANRLRVAGADEILGRR